MGKETKKQTAWMSSANALLVFLSFWLTALIVRGAIFWYAREGIIPAIFIHGYHIHHFVTGFLMLLLALMLSRKRHTHHIPEVLAGSGLALVFDELVIWTRQGPNYWSLANLAAVAAIGTLLMLYYISRKRREPLFQIRERHRLYWTSLIASVIGSIMLLALFFSYFNRPLAELKTWLFADDENPVVSTASAQVR